MKSHLTIWSITALAVAAAVAAMLARQTVTAPPVPPVSGEQLTQIALDRLRADPAIIKIETQAAIRSAAARVEEGEINSAEGYYLLALQLKREQNLNGSEAYYKRAIAMRPDWSWPYAGLGDLLGRHTLGRTQEAQEVLRKAIELEPGWAQPHNILALLLREEDRLEEAETEALLALKLAPRDLASNNNYANLLVSLERYDEAETYYKKAIELSGNHPKPIYNLACLYSVMGRRDEALEQLGRALNQAGVLRREAADDPDFEALRDDHEFRQMVFGSEDSGHGNSREGREPSM